MWFKIKKGVRLIKNHNCKSVFTKGSRVLRHEKGIQT